MATTEPAAGTATDRLLAARLSAGDDLALAELLDLHGAVARAAARRVLGPVSGADDVVQDVFVSLWRWPDRYDPQRGSLRTYVALLANRWALDVLRAERRRRSREERAGARWRAGPSSEHTPDLEGSIRLAVDKLPAPQRDAVRLAFFEGRSYRDVATVLGIAEGTAKSRLRLGLAKLQDELSRDLLEST